LIIEIPNNPIGPTAVRRAIEITRNRYVISLMVIDSVRYLSIEKTANSPKAKPIEISAECKSPVTINTPVPKSMYDAANGRFFEC
jgi:hypothetical protein